MKDKFYITELIKRLIDSFDQYLTNFPHKERNRNKKRNYVYFLSNVKDCL